MIIKMLDDGHEANGQLDGLVTVYVCLYACTLVFPIVCVYSTVPILINPFASRRRTGASNVFLLKSAGRLPGTSNEISMSKVSLYISRNTVSFFFLLWI